MQCMPFFISLVHFRNHFWNTKKDRHASKFSNIFFAGFDKWFYSSSVESLKTCSIPFPLLVSIDIPLKDCSISFPLSGDKLQTLYSSAYFKMLLFFLNKQIVPLPHSCFGEDILLPGYLGPHRNVPATHLVWYQHPEAPGTAFPMLLSAYRCKRERPIEIKDYSLAFKWHRNHSPAFLSVMWMNSQSRSVVHTEECITIWFSCTVNCIQLFIGFS